MLKGNAPSPGGWQEAWAFLSDPVEGATVVVRGGKVVAAGAGVAVPAGVQVLDGSGTWVTPGLFATVTNLGLWDVGAVRESNDIRAGMAF